MKYPWGFAHIAVAVSIGLVAIVMVGTAYYLIEYKADDIAPTESATHAAANTNTTLNQNTNTNANENVNTAVNENTNMTSGTNENVNTTASTACLWQTYANEEYGYTIDYPCDWTVEYEESNDSWIDVAYHPVRNLHFYSPGQTYRLSVGLMQEGDDGSALYRTGIGAGDIQNGETITIEGQTVQLANLVFESQVNEVFGDNPSAAGNTVIDGFIFQSYFGCNTMLDFDDYSACEETDLLVTDEYVIMKQILETIDLP